MHACNSNLQFSDRHVLAGNCRTMHGVRSGAVQVFGGDTNNGHLTPAAPEGCRPATGSGPPTANGMDCWSWSWFFQPSRGPCGTGKTWGISATRRRRGTDVVQSGRQEVGAAPPGKTNGNAAAWPVGLWRPVDGLLDPTPHAKHAGKSAGWTDGVYLRPAAREPDGPGRQKTLRHFAAARAFGTDGVWPRNTAREPGGPGGGVWHNSDVWPMTPRPLCANSWRVSEKRRNPCFCQSAAVRRVPTRGLDRRVGRAWAWPSGSFLAGNRWSPCLRTGLGCRLHASPQDITPRGSVAAVGLGSTARPGLARSPGKNVCLQVPVSQQGRQSAVAQ